MLLSSRCIKTEGFLLTFPLNSASPVFLSQIEGDVHAGKSQKYTPACISTSLSIKRVYTRNKTLEIHQKLKQIGLHKTFLPGLSPKQPSFIQINTDKYSNTDLVDFSYEVGLFSKQLLDGKERDKRLIGDWLMIEFSQLVIDFNDVLKLTEESLEMRVVQSDKMYERIFGLKLIDREKKKYALESEFGNKMIIKPQIENQYRVEVWTT